MDLKKLIFPSKEDLIAPVTVLSYFLLMIFLKAVIPQNDVPVFFVYIFLPVLVMSIPLWPFLKLMGLWSTTAVWDASGPTVGGFIATAVIWAVAVYIIVCVVEFLKRKD
jgi:hypothetical protein